MLLTLDLMIALGRLSDVDRETFFDATVLEIPQAVLAERDGVSHQAISLRMKRARRDLRKHLT